MVSVYGIKNCSTVKKALDWLDNNGVEYTFLDFKKEGVDRDKLSYWAEKVGWDKLVNRKGTTWRKLSPDEQLLVDNAGAAFALLSQQTSIIKRPVLEYQDEVLLGFDEEVYTELLK